MYVLADDNITVEPAQEDPSPSVKELAKDRPKNLKDLAKISDDKVLYRDEIRKKFPDIKDFLDKNLFKGKGKLTVKELKEEITKFNIEDANKYWVSLDKWSGMQRELDQPQMVVQLNMTKNTLDVIRKDEILTDFFDDYFKMFTGGLHPMHGNTIGWARVYKFPEKWIVEEIQTDLLGTDVKLEKGKVNRQIDSILDGFDEEEQKKIKEFASMHLADWDKDIMSAIFEMARQAGVKDIWIFDADVKKKHLRSKSKLKRFYKIIPRDFGFKSGTLEEGGKKLKAWHRVVARKQKNTGEEMKNSVLLAALQKVVANDIVPRSGDSVEIPPDEKREMLGLFYQTLLTAMGREGEFYIFKQAIKQIPDREVEKEFKAVTDGTVSKIVKTLVRDDLTLEEKEEMAAIFEGLAKPYFSQYDGDVPQEDLDWAHNQISEFFDKTERQLIGDKGGKVKELT